MNKGYLCWSVGNWSSALECYEHVLELEPSHFEATWLKGLNLDNLLKFDEALACYDRALEMHPNAPIVAYNKACTLAKLNCPDSALDWLRLAIQGDSKYGRLAQDDTDWDSLRQSQDPKLREQFSALIPKSHDEASLQQQTEHSRVSSVLADALRRHLEKMKSESKHLAEFIEFYLDSATISDLVYNSAERLLLSCADGEVHSRAIIRSPIYYNLWAFPFDFSEAVLWFKRRFGGYSTAMLTSTNSDAFKENRCEVLVDIAYARNGAVAITIAPVSRRFQIGLVLTRDLLSEAEKRDLDTINRRI